MEEIAHRAVMQEEDLPHERHGWRGRSANHEEEDEADRVSSNNQNILWESNTTTALREETHEWCINVYCHLQRDCTLMANNHDDLMFCQLA
eukprot:4982472-Amphidinium_carterae.1